MRYAANLLFEYGVDRHRSRRPLCEKRIVVFDARSPREAARRARRHGERQALHYRNADGRIFRISFLGLVDLLELDGDDSREAPTTSCSARRDPKLI
jgi:hypothetical protein